MNHFLLTNSTAEKLYESVKNLPVIDYHNHLSVADICADKRYYDIYELWVKPDPYKHRAMRMCGVPEEYITGNAGNEEKFKRWCETVPMLIGNPLYHWVKMELETVFGIREMPNGDNANEIYALCNDYLKSNTVTANSLLKKFGVECACPCVSLTDDIRAFADNPMISPSLRGDDIVNITYAFIEKLGAITQTEITDLNSFEATIEKRLKDFLACGCVFSDHALDNGFRFYEDDGKNEDRFLSVLRAQPLDAVSRDRLSSCILCILGKKYAEFGFVMQLHIGAERSTSSVLRAKAGAAGGYAGIGNSVDLKSLVSFLDTLDRNEARLPKTVLFTLNPADNAMLSILSGSYAKDGVKGLVTQGPAWWWCDHKQGIREMLDYNAAYGLLANFVGMTTDSRSFLSFVRHDYFRRILCSFLGEKFEEKDFCCSYADLENLAVRMCYKNAKEIIGGNDNGCLF